MLSQGHAVKGPPEARAFHEAVVHEDHVRALLLGEVRPGHEPARHDAGAVRELERDELPRELRAEDLRRQAALLRGREAGQRGKKKRARVASKAGEDTSNVVDSSQAMCYAK